MSAKHNSIQLTSHHHLSITDDPEYEDEGKNNDDEEKKLCVIRMLNSYKIYQ